MQRKLPRRLLDGSRCSSITGFCRVLGLFVASKLVRSVHCIFRSLSKSMPDWIVPALSLCLSACLPVPLSVCDACGCGRVCLFVCLVLRRIMSYVSLCVCVRAKPCYVQCRGQRPISLCCPTKLRDMLGPNGLKAFSDYSAWSCQAPHRDPSATLGGTRFIELGCIQIFRSQVGDFG